MMQLIEANWPWLLIAVLIGLATAWLIYRRTRRTTVTREGDPVDGGETRATRNQALIDAPPAAAGQADPARRQADVPVVPAAPLGVAGAEAAIAAAADAGAAQTRERDKAREQDEASEAAPDRPAAPDPVASPVTGPMTEPTPVASQSTPVEPVQVAPTPVTRAQPTAEPTPATPTAAAPAPAADAAPPADDLTRIKGLGPKLAARLGELGVTGVAQIAAWNEADIDRIDGELGRFAGRIRRDDWVRQARLLQSDDRQAYEETFGKL